MTNNEKASKLRDCVYIKDCGVTGFKVDWQGENDGRVTIVFKNGLVLQSDLNDLDVSHLDDY